MVVALALALLLLLLMSGVASAHALLARSDPPANAILDQAPTQVRLWFTEEVNPALSQAVVVDKDNHEVDRKDSHVSSSNPREIDVSLNTLQPGAYVVIWKTVSAEDGHATGSNFLFRVRFPDGSVPALPGNIPSGPAGFSNSSSGQCLTGSSPLLCAPEVLSDWIVFLAMAVFVGGIFWQAYMVERAAEGDGALIATAIATGRRFRRVAPVALVVFLVANITYVMGQTMLEGGSWASGFSPTLWAGALLHSSFGVFWLLRELLGLLALLLLVLFPEPSASVEDWHSRRGVSWGRMALGLCLLAALAFSGHAAAAQAKGGIGSFAVPVDWLHLLAMSLWVGGLFFIAITLFPAIWSYEPAERGRVAVKLLPRFSIIALVSVAVAALSGSFNTDVQLTSWNQFIDTSYGRTLIIKILLFMVMMGISAYHAYRIRPALSRELALWDSLQAEDAASSDEDFEAQETLAVSEPARKKAAAIARRQKAGAAPQTLAQAGTAEVNTEIDQAAHAQNMQSESGSDTIAASHTEKQEASQRAQMNGRKPESSEPPSRSLRQIERLSEGLRTWIRREATLGAGVLLCAALLAGLAGSLAPAVSGAPNTNAPTLTATSSAPVNLTQTVDNLKVTLKVSPDKFGTNSFGVLVLDATTGKPIDGGNVHIVINMLDMDMGTSTADLKGTGKGFYLGQGDLLMGGHWQVQVQVRVPQDPTTIHRFTFDFTVNY